MASYDVDICVLLSLSLIPGDASFTTQDSSHSFGARHVGKRWSLSWDSGQLLTPLPVPFLCSSKHMFRIGNVSFVWALGDQSALVPCLPALRPAQCAASMERPHALCLPCPSVGQGSGIPAHHQNQEGITWRLALPQNPV